MILKRRTSLHLIAGALVAASCGKSTFNRVRVASTRSDTNALIAEIYAAALERAGIPVERHMRFGSEVDVADALERGDVDLYPGDASDRFQSGTDLARLDASPANDSPCLATSQYNAEKYWLLSLSACARMARDLRLAAASDFIAPGGPLDRLRERYGGFRFRSILPCDPGTQYYTLNSDKADVVNAVTIDASIAEDQLVILADDKRFWPQRRSAPVVRLASIRQHPRARAVLNQVSKRITLFALQQMNMRRKLFHLDAYDIAAEFVRVGPYPHAPQ